MALAPHEQHELLRMERMLSRDPAVRSAFHAFDHRCLSRSPAAPEYTSPWHPLLWRAAGVAMAGVTVAFAVSLIIVLVCRALLLGASECRNRLHLAP
jgi:hypothetical protein